MYRFILPLLLLSFCLQAQPGKFHVIAYYSAGPEQVDKLPAEKLSHIIFSFCHLKGNKLSVDSRRDSTTIQKLVALKKRNPSLKVILSLGGWGGCAPCSGVFSTDKGRKEFAQSVLQLNQYFKSDGIDLDWEYPAIEGYPEHQYIPEDKQNFTALVRDLRKTLGNKYEVSFAAGGFQKFLEESIEWKEVMKEVDRVNLMTYDLVNGYATVTGHHTALYSTSQLHESTDNAVQYLIKLGIPSNKLVIGGAFYGRMWEGVAATNNGLYQSGKFKAGIDFKNFDQELSEQKGFVKYWDDVAKAPYIYNAQQQLFVTFDDKQSLALKTAYAIDHKLDGIMFWELSLDTEKDGLLDAIVNTVKLKSKKK
ncbi:MAG TPA: glycoside hydrolase family 18 protein [Ohtaekwangia sp.]|uniref:glycoside hydrolase family 18 protein n=1 Tax=Ohtaekwangia sp. TaxID=2066019 RepID=UPI002F9425C3